MWLTSGELNESSIGPEAGAAGAKLKRVANSGTGDGRRPELATNARLCQSEQKPHTVLQEAFVHAFTCLGVCVVVVLSCCVSGCRREPQGGVPICARVLHLLNLINRQVAGPEFAVIGRSSRSMPCCQAKRILSLGAHCLLADVNLISRREYARAASSQRRLVVLVSTHSRSRRASPVEPPNDVPQSPGGTAESPGSCSGRIWRSLRGAREREPPPSRPLVRAELHQQVKR